jgi:hypothetical protein
MRESRAMVRRHFLCTMLSGSGLVAAGLAGCGSSGSQVEMTPDAKKTITASKVGDESKFIKPKGKRGKKG